MIENRSANCQGSAPNCACATNDEPDTYEKSAALPSAPITTFTANTRSRQRACQKVAEEIKIGETISGTLTIVYDQQKLNSTDPEDQAINAAYKALPEGGEVFLFIANGWDQDQEPDATTVGDLWRVRVSQIAHRRGNSSARTRTPRR